YLGLRPEPNLWAQTPAASGKGQGQSPARATRSGRDALTVEEYDSLAKLANNENPWGPPESVMKAMTQAFKYANRYGYPDGGIVQAIADHHGVKPENVLLGAGSSEVLVVADQTFLQGGKKVLSVEPTYGTVYQYATATKADAIKLPLLPDYRQDIPGMIRTAHHHYREIGFIYLCNPNNPTGVIVTKEEVKQLLDGIPKDMPVLIDEAYHHFVEDPKYATSVPYVLEGRPVIIARTFSKIAALAAMRIGYAVAPAEMIQKMRPFSMGSVNVAARFGAVAALKDTQGQADIKKRTIALRKKTQADLEAYGYETIPSETNFFMVSIGREIQPVIDEFAQKKVAVGRPFPPMNKHMRVSVGTEDEMARFVTAFKEILPQKPRPNAGD